MFTILTGILFIVIDSIKRFWVIKGIKKKPIQNLEKINTKHLFKV